jgi:hypothetical protein
MNPSSERIRAMSIKQSYDNKEIFERSRKYAIKIPIAT